jgi:hypothetical protein
MFSARCVFRNSQPGGGVRHVFKDADCAAHVAILNGTHSKPSLRTCCLIKRILKSWRIRADDLLTTNKLPDHCRTP